MRWWTGTEMKRYCDDCMPTIELHFLLLTRCSMIRSLCNHEVHVGVEMAYVSGLGGPVGSSLFFVPVLQIYRDLVRVCCGVAFLLLGRVRGRLRLRSRPRRDHRTPAGSSRAPARHAPGNSRHVASLASLMAWLEAERGKALQNLRILFSSEARRLNLNPPPVGIFERWHFANLLRATKHTFDPLLPFFKNTHHTSYPEDHALVQELTRAGAQPANAIMLAKSVRKSFFQHSTALRTLILQQGPIGTPVQVVLDMPDSQSSSDAILYLDAQGIRLKLTREHYFKLKGMHERSHDSESIEEFHYDCFRLLYRYKSLGGPGFQASIGETVLETLRHVFGCCTELFASPLNACLPFYSAFDDVDSPFGSYGSFFDSTLVAGSYEANPPFVPLLVEKMVLKMQKLLEVAAASEKELLFVIIVGASSGMRKEEAWNLLTTAASGKFGRANWIVPLHKHGFLAGHAHISKASDRTRMSSCDTAIIVLATDAAAQRWPSTAEVEKKIRDALHSSVPRKLKRPTLAARRIHQQRKKKKQR